MAQKGFEIYVKGGMAKKWTKLGTASGMQGQHIFKDKIEAEKVINNRIITNSWLKPQNFQIREFKQDKRAHGRITNVKF